MMTTTLRVAMAACALLLSASCGGGTSETPDTTAQAPASPAATSTSSPSATADPCSLAPLAEWEAATDLTGLTHSRDGNDTCDVLDDANARAAGSVSVVSPSLYDATVARMKGEAVDEVGDEAYWVTRGPGVLYAKRGDRALSVMVNPHGTSDHRAVAIRLARVALAR